MECSYYNWKSNSIRKGMLKKICSINSLKRTANDYYFDCLNKRYKTIKLCKFFDKSSLLPKIPYSNKQVKDIKRKMYYRNIEKNLSQTNLDLARSIKLVKKQPSNVNQAYCIQSYKNNKKELNVWKFDGKHYIQPHHNYHFKKCNSCVDLSKKITNGVQY